MNMKIGQKVLTLALSVSLSASVVIGAVSIFSMESMKHKTVAINNQLGDKAAQNSKNALEKQAKEKLQIISDQKSAYIEAKFDNIQNYVKEIADTTTNIYDHPGDYPNRIAREPIKNLQGVSAQLMFSNIVRDKNAPALRAEVGKVANIQDLLIQINDKDKMVASTYIATKSGITIMADSTPNTKFANSKTGGPNPYEAFARPWYQKASRELRLVFTDVAYDVNGGGMGIICAAPFYKGTEFMGVAGTGCFLDDINSVVKNTSVGKTGYAFIVNQNGHVLISPKKTGEVKASPDSPADLRKSGNRILASTAAGMLAGESNVEEIPIDGQKVYIAYSPLPDLGWSFATVIEADEVDAPAVSARNDIEKLTDQAASDINGSIWFGLTIMLLAVALAVVVLSAVCTILSRRITNPILNLADGVKHINGGNLDYRLDVQSRDEVGTLAESFNNMTAELKAYISNLSKVTADKERIATELNVAKQIQSSMLPCIFPPFPEHDEFDIYATMQPAKEVGGDFYDFFLVDENHLAFVVADVSGKGVPAALFMVIAKTLIKNHAQAGEEPCTVFGNVNQQLCENNEAGMFVTAWMGILELDSGKLIFANAGHNPPVLKRASGSFEYLRSEPGFVLAGLENIVYKPLHLQLEAGDILYVYTDGVTEATDTQDQLFGEERLRQSLESGAFLPPTGLLPHVKADIDAFVKGADQFDDITMLALKYKKVPNENKK